MFNCLQEGIIVVKEKKLGEEPTDIEHQLFFVNDIGNRILKTIFKTKNFMENDSFVNSEQVINKKVFYEFKTIQVGDHD